MTHFGIFIPARRATGDGVGCEAPGPSFLGWRRRGRARTGEAGGSVCLFGGDRRRPRSTSGTTRASGRSEDIIGQLL